MSHIVWRLQQLIPGENNVLFIIRRKQNQHNNLDINISRKRSITETYEIMEPKKKKSLLVEKLSLFTVNNSDILYSLLDTLEANGKEQRCIRTHNIIPTRIYLSDYFHDL